jgi:uncharacterized protein (DUF433 family)
MAKAEDPGVLAFPTGGSAVSQLTLKEESLTVQIAGAMPERAKASLRCSELGGRTMDWRERILVDQKILVGKPVIRGTRISVEFVVDLLAQGWTEAQILDSYPGISREDILACLKYASEILKSERVYPVPA